jgi:hypothetical protein
MSNLPARKGQEESVPLDLKPVILMSESESSLGLSSGKSTMVALAAGTLGGGAVHI